MDYLFYPAGFFFPLFDEAPERNILDTNTYVLNPNRFRISNFTNCVSIIEFDCCQPYHEFSRIKLIDRDPNNIYHILFVHV
jgi:hypothetical protein